MKQPFVIYYRRGTAWLDGRTVFEQPLQDHLAYMKSLAAAGTLRLGGPFTDDCGGMVVIDAEGADEARAIMEADPAVRDRVMEAEAHPWKLLAGAL
ncbi:YciI family protein [Variovorax sp. J22P271]|uniref:YciI family protein n=1 Tax=Variovorax davisae TaxID=3053515 RepID=UPI002574F305|nr:YciI family protein [Variovorax sp. J22P271]MDM0033274.1 YciI family protein [Variovorax sp. J22P271]